MKISQYKNWCDFSLRMAEHADFGLRRRGPSRQQIVETVHDVLSHFEDPRAHGPIVDWDSCDPFRGPNGGYNEIVGDYVASMCDDEMPYFEGLIRQREDDRLFDARTGDDDEDDEDEPDEEMIERRAAAARRQWERQFWSPISCSVRAGLDMATRIGGGVIGFTVGDLRRMYPQGLPRFVTRHFPRNMRSMSDEHGVWL